MIAARTSLGGKPRQPTLFAATEIQREGVR